MDMFVIFLKKILFVNVVLEVWEAQNAIKAIALNFQTVLQLHLIKFSPDYSKFTTLKPL